MQRADGVAGRPWLDVRWCWALALTAALQLLPQDVGGCTPRSQIEYSARCIVRFVDTQISGISNGASGSTCRAIQSRTGCESKSAPWVFVNDANRTADAKRSPTPLLGSRIEANCGLSWSNFSALIPYQSSRKRVYWPVATNHPLSAPIDVPQTIPYGESGVPSLTPALAAKPAMMPASYAPRAPPPLSTSARASGSSAGAPYAAPVSAGMTPAVPSAVKKSRRSSITFHGTAEVR